MLLGNSVPVEDVTCKMRRRGERLDLSVQQFPQNGCRGGKVRGQHLDGDKAQQVSFILLFSGQTPPPSEPTGLQKTCSSVALLTASNELQPTYIPFLKLFPSNALFSLLISPALTWKVCPAEPGSLVL